MREKYEIGDLVDTLPELDNAGLVGTISDIWPDGTLAVVFNNPEQEYPYRPDDVLLYIDTPVA